MKLFYVFAEYNGEDTSNLDRHIWATDKDEAIELWTKDGAEECDIDNFNPIAVEVPLKAPKKPKVLFLNTYKGTLG